MGSVKGPVGIYEFDSVFVWDARVSVISVVFVHLFSGFRRPGDRWCASQWGDGFLDHPRTPTWLYYTPCPSIWRLLMIKELASLRAVSAIAFDQCIFDAPALKPTTCLLARLPHFRVLTLESGCGGRCPHGPGAHAGWSRQANGRLGWRPSLVGWRPWLLNSRPSLVGWRPSLLRWRPSVWRPLLVGLPSLLG